MTMQPPLLKSKKIEKYYPINQCALYGIGSKSKLANVLQSSLSEILELAKCGDNYRVFLLPESTCKFTGKKVKERWVQEPKRNLRKIHDRLQKLLRNIIPPGYAHAAVKGRSYRSNALVHAAADRIATFDIRKFYPSTSRSSVYDFFSSQLACAPDIAALLVKIVCCGNGLPTGSPLSPILSLYANKRIFDELNALAQHHSLLFTCYVDDLTFSGAMLPRGLAVLIRNIVEKNGHTISSNKTRIFRRDQRKHVTGVALFKGQVEVPHARFLKARAITTAIDASISAVDRLLLVRKLAGLLGEAAYLDKQFASWAQRTYIALKIITVAAAKELDRKASTITRVGTT